MEIEPKPITEGTTPDALVSALTDPGTRYIAESEIWRRIQEGNRANRLAVEFLLNPDCGDSESSPLGGLIRVCWKALKGLRVGSWPGIYGERRYETWQETRSFVRQSIWKDVFPFASRPRGEIYLAGLNGEFNFLPRRVRLAAINQIRHDYARLEAETDQLSEYSLGDNERRTDLERKTLDTLEWRAYHRPGTIHGDSLSVPKEDLPRAVEDIRQALKYVATEREFQTLTILAKAHASGDAGNTTRQRKGFLTRAIVKARGVSERQARKDKDAALQSLSNAGYQGKKILRALLENGLNQQKKDRGLRAETIEAHHIEQMASGSEYHRARAEEYNRLTEAMRQDITTQWDPVYQKVKLGFWKD